jgi:hypothetical protein
MAAKLKRFLEKHELIDPETNVDIDGRTGQFFYGPTRYGDVPTPLLPAVGTSEPMQEQLENQLKRSKNNARRVQSEYDKQGRRYAGILERVLPDAPESEPVPSMDVDVVRSPGGMVPDTAFNADPLLSDSVEQRIAEFPAVDEAGLLERWQTAQERFGLAVQPVPKELLDDAYFFKEDQLTTVSVRRRRLMMPAGGERYIRVTIDGVSYDIAASEIMVKTTLNAFAEHIITKCGGFACVLIDRFTKLAVKIVEAEEEEARQEVALIRAASTAGLSPALIYGIRQLDMKSALRPYLLCYTMEAYEGTLQNLLTTDHAPGKGGDIVVGLNALMTASLRYNTVGHGDLHPDNVVYRKTEIGYAFKLIDWGSPMDDVAQAGFVSVCQWLCYGQALIPAFAYKQNELLSRSVCNRVMLYVEQERSDAANVWHQSMLTLASWYTRFIVREVRVYNGGVGYYARPLPVYVLPCGSRRLS